MQQIKILVIEDDETAAKWLHSFLCDNDFIVDTIHTITDGISYLKHNKYDLIILDLNLPDFSGFELLKSMKNNISLPVIVTSAYNDTTTKVQTFKYGASDYMVKPIDLEELGARIWALLGRSSEIKISDKAIFEIYDTTVYFNHEPLDVTTTEFQILEHLIKNKNKTISRNNLASALSSISSPRSLDHHIKNIRLKINDSNKNNKYLKTEYGIGYKLVF